MTTRTGLEHARAVADAVLYEGYLLYPYRAGSTKNQSRWQFGVLGPPGAADAGWGEDPALAAQVLVRPFGDGSDPVISMRLRFLHLQQRSAQRRSESGEFEDVAELVVGGQRWLSWEEATEGEITLGPWPLSQLRAGRKEPMTVAAGSDIETVCGDAAVAGRLVRTRRSLQGRIALRADRVAEAPGLIRLSARVENTTAAVDPGTRAAIAASFIGAHLLVDIEGGEFLSMTDPPSDAVAATCAQHRCWPVLAGPDGDRSVLLISPIILYDHPELAPESAGALFDSTEIDEILTLRIMTLTEEEKEAARATDPRAAAIIDRCDAMSAQDMQRLHGALRDPHAAAGGRPDALEPFAPSSSVRSDGVDLSGSLGFGDDVPWWDPAVDASVSPFSDVVWIDGVAVSAGSVVRIHPSRRADAQDLFFADQLAKVTAVHGDVDGETHVALVLVDDPAADLHEWYGRYLYFAPDELEPISGAEPAAAIPPNRRESRS